MSKNTIKEFKRLVADGLMRKYGLSEFEATKAVHSSYLAIALKADAETAMHDSIDEWADYIYDEELGESLKEM